jgi:hypothetical protein
MAAMICYTHQEKSHTVSFKHRDARLPIRTRQGDVQLCQWGRRQNELSHLPLGGWAQLSDIQTKKWQPFFPKPVKLAVLGFMEYDLENNQHWFTLTNGHYLQGLFARYDQDARVYLVTITPQRSDNIFLRWPRILCTANTFTLKVF